MLVRIPTRIYIPPVKTQGSKAKLVRWILGYIKPEETDRWIEPFMGSGVVGFNLNPRRAIFADANPHIINFYNAIKAGDITHCKAKLFLEREKTKLLKRGKAYYYEVRERFNAYGAPLDFLFLNRTCFNGIVRFNREGKFNTPLGRVDGQRYSPSS